MCKIRIIEPEEKYTELHQVEKLFVQMYEHMKDAGLKTPLIEGGEKLWRKSLEKTIGRFGKLILAVKGRDVIGFAHGIIKLSPDYLGGEKTGLITHVYVSPEERNTGVGGKMVNVLEKWFDDQNVQICELSVLSMNDMAISFWKDLGFMEKQIQMFKAIK